MSKGKIKRRVKKSHRGRGTAPRAADCYKDAFGFVISYGAEDEKNIILAHGIPTLRDPKTHESTGVRYGHAWVEVGGAVVLDVVAKTHVPLDLYYEEGNINPDEVVRYTRSEARAQVIEHETYGPWDERFFADDIKYANKGGRKK